MRRVLTPAVRRWLYGVAIAFVPLALHLKWIEPEAVPVIIPLVVAILNVKEDEPRGPVG